MMFKNFFSEGTTGMLLIADEIIFNVFGALTTTSLWNLSQEN